ncbi:MAG: hypothetical protein PVG78_08710 [Desulfobacterales bacterium]|jgi:hypothetical protein
MKTTHVLRLKAAAAVAIGAIFFLAAMVSTAAAMGEKIIGKVVRDAGGYVLVADSGEYLLSGKPVADLAEKTVAVDGDVEYGAAAKTLRVDSAVALKIPDRAVADPGGGVRSG